MPETTAYKILTRSEADALRRGNFTGAPIDLADGYIHLSTATQLQATLEKHFAGQPDLFLATVHLPSCGEALRWEVSRDGQLFPHLYAPLTMAQITALVPLDRQP